MINLAKSDDIAARKTKARQIVAYLTYVMDDVRTLSPTSSYLLELTIAAINEDMRSRMQRKSEISA